MRSARKILYASVVIAAIGILSKLWLFGALVRFGIRDQTALRKRNEVRGIYLKVPFPLNFKLYFFNVTNPDDIQNGAKPIVKEVGPYWYDEYKEKVDVVDNDTEDSLTYTPYDLFYFNENKSLPLRDDDYVTVIHPVLVGLVSLVIRDSPVFLPIVNKALPFIFNDPKSIFLTAKVKDILFDGFELNCTSKEFAVTAICGQMKSQVQGLQFKKDDPNVILFSLLGPRNATITSRIKILRGIFHSEDVGRVIEVNGKKQLAFWSTEQCNRFNGTDGWIFPPLREAQEGYKSFSTDLCRNVKLNYVNDTIYKKIHVRYFETELGDQTNDKEEKCFCRQENVCLKKGLFDLTKCMGVPLYATLPHFLHTDESYLKKIDGLAPNEANHSIMAYFEPMTGTPVSAAKRMQFNFELLTTPKLALFSKLPSALFPMFWLEESIDLEGYLLKKIQGIFLMLLLADILLYAAIIFGIGGLAFGLYSHFKNRKTVNITPMPNIEKNDDSMYEDGDAHQLTRKEGLIETDKIGAVNHAMSGHEFDKY